MEKQRKEGAVEMGLKENEEDDPMEKLDVTSLVVKSMCQLELLYYVQ